MSISDKITATYRSRTTFLFSLTITIFACCAIPQDIRAQNSNDTVYEWAEQLPRFKGGNDALNDYLRKNLRYPQSAIDSAHQGRVWVRFIVGRDGKISAPEILRSPHASLNVAALAIVRDMPAWYPGIMNGNPVPTRASFPITFELAEQTPDSSIPRFKGDDFNTFIYSKMRYPPTAAAANIGGTVTMSLSISKTGDIEELKVAEHALDPTLDAEAVRLMRLTEWLPAIKKGKPVTKQVVAGVVFSPAMIDRRKGYFMEVEDSTLSRHPSFPGGMQLYPLYILINKQLFINTESPLSRGYARVRMKVLSDGRITDVTVLNSLGEKFDQECFRLIDKMLNWVPAVKDGKTVDCAVVLTIPFTKQGIDSPQ